MRLHNDVAAVPESGSLRSLAVATTAGVAFRPLTSVIPANPIGVRLSRSIVAGAMAAFGPPLHGTSVIAVRRPTSYGPEVRGEWVRASGAARDDAVVLYLHGSGYAVCSARTHRGVTSRLSHATGLPVFSCDYRLAPTHRFPSSADDVRAAYDWVLAEGYAADRVVVAGDSAGGHLALDLTLQLIREGRPAPVALALFSPVLDLTMRLAAARERTVRDPLISAGRAARLLGLYTVGTDASDERLAFSFAGARDFPPTIVQAGSREMLAADAEFLARALDDAGAPCELEIWPGQVHVFQALPRLVPEAEAALARAASFVVGQLDAADRRAAMASVREA